MLRGDIIKLSDFGLAMYVPGLKEGSAYLRGRCGTKGYIAPEVDTNDLYNLKADIYSIGVAIHELYSGEPLKEVGVISRNLPPMLADLISKLC
jgi:serine/threonine protein kinase